jgi:hypothetical protein
MKKINNLIILIFIAFITLISCSKDDELSQIKTQNLKFEKTSGNLSKNVKLLDKPSEFSLHKVKIDSKGIVSTDDNNLQISKGKNKENGIMSYIITKKSKKIKTNLKSLKFAAKVNTENDGWSIESGFWYDGHDCFLYGTIYTDNNGVRLFVRSPNLATRYLMDSCGWSNMG